MGPRIGLQHVPGFLFAQISVRGRGAVVRMHLKREHLAAVQELEQQRKTICAGQADQSLRRAGHQLGDGPARQWPAPHRGAALGSIGDLPGLANRWPGR